MGLSQSLYTGWTGMATHQRSLDNTGNNLANVNTVGFRKSDFLFSNLFNQMLNTGGIPEEGTHGATNPKSLGVGTTTGAIVHNFKQGPIETTDNPLDVAISGNGFFLANTGYGTALTRSGSFYLDHTVNAGQRMLCVGDGYAIQGWNAVNGSITPSATVSNILIPAIGDAMSGTKTTKVDLNTILPTNTSSRDFNGVSSSQMDLKGNLAQGQNTLTTSIFAAVTSSVNGAVTARNEVREVKVEITFDGPTASPDGSLDNWAWTMKTVDWPNPGDTPVQIYPPLDNPEFTQDKISFYAESSAEKRRGAGQAVNGAIRLGGTRVDAAAVDPAGNEVQANFTMPSGFTLDVSRLTALTGEAPGGGELQTWHVNGNPKGTMARTINIFDEYTEFIETTDDAGNAVMRPVRVVESRADTLYFRKEEADDASTTWSWKSSADGASGTLRFNTIGDLVETTGGGGSIDYNFDGARHINYEGSVQAAAQDGYRNGNLKSITIDHNGKIFGHYSNNMVEPLAQIAMGTVQNTAGLEGTSGTLFYTGVASGPLIVGIAGSAGNTGLVAVGDGLTSGALEGSNVDLSQEFTSLISIERGYQLNGRIITTSDEMLQTALGVKR